MFLEQRLTTRSGYATRWVTDLFTWIIHEQMHSLLLPSSHLRDQEPFTRQNPIGSTTFWFTCDFSFSCSDQNIWIITKDDWGIRYCHHCTDPTGICICNLCAKRTRQTDRREWTWVNESHHFDNIFWWYLFDEVIFIWDMDRLPLTTGWSHCGRLRFTCSSFNLNQHIFIFIIHQ